MALVAEWSQVGGEDGGEVRDESPRLDEVSGRRLRSPGPGSGRWRPEHQRAGRGDGARGGEPCSGVMTLFTDGLPRRPPTQLCITGSIGGAGFHECL